MAATKDRSNNHSLQANPLPAGNTLIFLHIPKTAGSTLHSVIKRQYTTSAFCHIKSEPESLAAFQQRQPSERAQIRLLMGHVEYGIHAELPQPATYFTMLRDPVKRIESYYAFVRRIKTHYCHEMVVANNWNLAEFIQNKADVMVDNGQTRMIAGVLYHYSFGECPPEVLEIAKNNLQNHFALVGLTEQFDESILLMQHLFGWRNVFYAQKNRRPVQADQPIRDPITQEAILAVNDLDIQLYQYAANLMAEMIGQWSGPFQEKLRRYRRMNYRLRPLTHYAGEIHRRLINK